jgi:hypothetical protein
LYGGPKWLNTFMTSSNQAASFIVHRKHFPLSADFNATENGNASKVIREIIPPSDALGIGQIPEEASRLEALFYFRWQVLTDSLSAMLEQQAPRWPKMED